MSDNDRLAEIKARCEAYSVEVKALLAENERLRKDNGSLARGYAEQLGDRQENIMLRGEVERLRAENAALMVDAKLGRMVRWMPDESLLHRRHDGWGACWKGVGSGAGLSPEEAINEAIGEEPTDAE